MVSASQKAFTLAEVLITLAIIGVVAALTIPTVVRNYRKMQTATQLKKVFSTLQNTTNLAIAEYGPIENWEFYTSGETDPVSGKYGSKHFANRYLIPYLKVAKVCDTDTPCPFKYKFLNGGAADVGANSGKYFPIITLQDGTSIIVKTFSTSLIDKYAEIYVDLNGTKPPNVLGKDVFFLWYILKHNTNPQKWNGKFAPEGIYETIAYLKNSNYCGCSTTSTNYAGRCCFAYIMKSGWKLPDDYPY